MKTLVSLSLILLPVVLGHQGHNEPADTSDVKPGGWDYAQRHVSNSNVFSNSLLIFLQEQMATEHHM